MFHLMNAIPIVGAIVLIFGVGLIVRALFANIRKESAPFRNYFGPNTSETSCSKAPSAIPRNGGPTMN